jgi:hypothetical protein
VTGLDARTRLRATWRGLSCDFEVTLPKPSRDPLPDLGAYTCAGVVR